jgi:hypothetical protein
MATYEEVATLASDINEKLGTTIQPDTLVHLIELFIEEDEVPFTEVPIEEIEEQVNHLLVLTDAFVVAQDGESIEEIDAVIDDTSEALGLTE